MHLFFQYGQALLFYLVFSIFTLLGLPLATRMFQNKTVAYVIAKPLGFLAFAYAIWLLSSLKILNYQSLWLILILLAVCLVWAGFSLKEIFKKIPYRSILTAEFFLLAIYFGYLFLRTYNPDINGAEKFMDMALLTSSGKTNFFPFMDFWFAGKAINYYYFGQYLFSLLANLSRIPYALAYNFSLALIVCQTLALSFTLVWLLTKSKFFSLLGALFTTIGGPAIYSACVIKASFWNLSIPGQCFYASASRFMDPAYLINELPSYSLIVADLHPHFISLPFFVLSLCLLWKMNEEQQPQNSTIIGNILALAVNALINPPNLPTLCVLFALIFFKKMWGIARTHKFSWKKFIADPEFSAWIKCGISMATWPLVLYAPFLLYFKSFVAGIIYAPAFAKAHNLYGSASQFPTPFKIQAGLWAVPFAIILLGMIAAKSKTWRGFIKEHFFELMLIVLSIGLIIFAELFFYGDLFHIANPPYFRANTIFKSDYQAWVLISIAAASLLSVWWKKVRSTKKFRKTQTAFFVVILAAASVFYFCFIWQGAVQAYLSGTNKNSLDGSEFIRAISPADFSAIAWLNQNQKNRTVILEAAGPSYQTFGRIGVFSGMINPINWFTHEWTWRFAYPKDVQNWRQLIGKSVNTGYDEVSAVDTDVKKIYSSKDPAETKLLLRKYGISYVYIGDLERTTYPDLSIDKFYQLGQVVFSSQGSELFKTDLR